jgi:small subunit ribosomal protein S15
MSMAILMRVATRRRSSLNATIMFKEESRRLLATATTTTTTTTHEYLEVKKTMAMTNSPSTTISTSTKTTSQLLTRGFASSSMAGNIYSTSQSSSSSDLSSNDGGEVLNLGYAGGEKDTQSFASTTRELVRRYKGLETASKAELNKIELARVRKEFAKWSADSGSSGVQIAALTAKIAYMTEHLKVHKKDKHGRFGLAQMLERRKKLLKYLRRTDATTYETVITTLGLKDRSFVEEALGAKWPTRGS